MGFQNRFKKVITFPKKHTDNFLGIFLMVKPSYAFWCWICLQLFLEKTRKSRYEKKKFGRRPKIRPKAEIPAEGRDPSHSTVRSNHIWRSEPQAALSLQI